MMTFADRAKTEDVIAAINNKLARLAALDMNQPEVSAEYDEQFQALRLLQEQEAEEMRALKPEEPTMMTTTFTYQKRIHLLDRHLHLVSDFYAADPRKTSLYWRLHSKWKFRRLALPHWNDVLWSSLVGTYFVSIFLEAVKNGFFFTMALILSGVALYFADIYLWAPGNAWLLSAKGDKMDPKLLRGILTMVVLFAGLYWAVMKALRS